MAIAVSGVSVRQVEVDLKKKPAEMLAISPKGTVPVLQLPDGRVLEQSLDIMRWALAQHDPEGWLDVDDAIAIDLITQNDTTFKRALDRYKYPERYPEKSQVAHREDGEAFLVALEDRLNRHAFLAGDAITYVDAAIMPFVRQFAAVDEAWWASAPYPRFRGWLGTLTASPVFVGVMAKQ
jgi:glutathione S-transferase